MVYAQDGRTDMHSLFIMYTFIHFKPTFDNVLSALDQGSILVIPFLNLNVPCVPEVQLISLCDGYAVFILMLYFNDLFAYQMETLFDIILLTVWSSCAYVRSLNLYMRCSLHCILSNDKPKLITS